MSYANMLLYMRTIPDFSYEREQRDKKHGGNAQEHIDASDPNNRDKVEKLLFG